MASKAKQLRMKLKAKKIEQEEILKKEENNIIKENNDKENEKKPEPKVKLKEISISSSSENEKEEKKDLNSPQKNNNNNIILVPEEEIDPLKFFDVNHINIDSTKNPMNEITDEIKKKNIILSKKKTKKFKFRRRIKRRKF